MNGVEIVTVEQLLKERQEEIASGKICKEAYNLREDQEIERRKNIRCKECGGCGVIWMRGQIAGYCGSGESYERMCDVCHGEAAPDFILTKDTLGYFIRGRHLW